MYIYIYTLYSIIICKLQFVNMTVYIVPYIYIIYMYSTVYAYSSGSICLEHQVAA